MEEKQIQPTLYETLFKKEWSYYTGAVLIVILAMTMSLVGGTWGVSGPLAIWAGKFFGIFGIDTASWGVNVSSYSFFGHQQSIQDIGLAFGALISCLLAAQWKIRNIKHYKQVLAAIIGGLCMGIGSRLARGCNIGGLFSQLPQFSLAAWVFLLFVFIGATVGGKLLAKFFMPPVSNKRPNRKRLTAEERARNRKIQISVGAALAVILLIVAFAVAPTYPSAPLYILLGVSLGYVMQRSRFCFTAAYRDPTTTGETKLTRAVIVAFALSSIYFFGVHASRFGADLGSLTADNMPGNPINLNLMIGAFIFGVGAVLAGGCASGTFVRMGEGYVQNWICFPFFCLGALIGTPLNAAMNQTFLGAGPKVYLPAVFGLVPALIIQLAALLGLWILASWWETRKKGA